MGIKELELLKEIMQSGGGSMGSMILLFIGYKYLPKIARKFQGDGKTGSNNNTEKVNLKIALLEQEKVCAIRFGKDLRAMEDRLEAKARERLNDLKSFMIKIKEN